ncbi:MAG: hypothetical protein GXY44_09515 [Phycisphaerales bacterium]|nr:hypothetical protein [Phycisphaerales bacterium]
MKDHADETYSRIVPRNRRLDNFAEAMRGDEISSRAVRKNAAVLAGTGFAHKKTEDAAWRTSIFRFDFRILA